MGGHLHICNASELDTSLQGGIMRGTVSRQHCALSKTKPRDDGHVECVEHRLVRAKSCS